MIMAVDVLPPHGSKSLPGRTVSSIKVRENLFSTLSQAITDKQQSSQIATGNALVSGVAELGRAVRVRRRSLKLSQTELAKTARVGRRFVSDFENGKETVALREALSVCNAAGLRIFLSSRD